MVKNRLEGNPQAELLGKLLGDARDICALALGMPATEVGNKFMVIYQPRDGVPDQHWQCVMSDTRFTVLAPGENGLKPLISLDVAETHPLDTDHLDVQCMEVVVQYRPTTWKMRWSWITYVFGRIWAEWQEERSRVLGHGLPDDESRRLHGRWSTYGLWERFNIMFVNEVVLTAYYIALERHFAGTEPTVSSYAERKLPD